MSFKVVPVSPDSIIGEEQLGSKTKFWFARGTERRLFKEGRAQTGEDWAEKVAAEIARLIGCKLERMKSLFLAWQAANRAWFPVGLLDADTARNYYAFRYTKGALEAEKSVGFGPLPAFPEFGRRYEAPELFPLFQNRVLNANRKNFAEYLDSLDLSPTSAGPIEILAVSGGTRQTDSLEVFPRIVKRPDNTFSCRFFLHGLRYMRKESQQRAMALQPGELLGVSLELTNPVTLCAIQLTSKDYEFVGWTPRYLVQDILNAIAAGPNVAATVVRVNPADVPANRRVLIELSGTLPASVEPMSSEPFQPLEERLGGWH